MKETIEDNKEHVEVNQMAISTYNFKAWFIKPSTCNIQSNADWDELFSVSALNSEAILKSAFLSES